jgi:hypothetical protein
MIMMGLECISVSKRGKTKNTWIKLFIDGNAKKKEKSKGENNVYRMD